MTFLSWRKDYEVGVLQIDTEHHRLFDLVNEFHETYLRGNGTKEIPRILNQLVSYAEEHFQHEEDLMSENDYPLIDKHRDQHSELVTSVFEINNRFVADPVKASAETLQFVKTWLHDHIVHDDMDIADFLLRKANQAKIATQHNSCNETTGSSHEKSEDNQCTDTTKEGSRLA